MHEQFRDAFLGAWGRLVASRPRTTLAVCLLLAAGCVALTCFKLQYLADRSELVDKELPWNKRYLNYKQAYPSWADVIVVLDGTPGDARVDALARLVADQVRADGRVSFAASGFDTAEAGPKLFAVGPRPVFDETMRQLAQAKRLAGAENANAALATLLLGLQSEGQQAGAIDQLQQFLDPYLAAMTGESKDAPVDFGFLLPTQSRWAPLVSDTGSHRLRFVRVRFAATDHGVNDLGEKLKWLRGTIRRIVGASEIPRTEWGVTGIPAIEADETTQSVSDASIASVLAMALILLLMLVAYRGLIVPLLGIGALMVGMAWSFGWLIITVGHLQVLSVVFTSILLGLGIDYALLFMSRLELIRDEHDDLASATARVFRGVGPGMLTGALTASLAFASTAFTQFKGMAEMGIIAGGGILLCVVAVLSVFPAALAVTGRWKKIVRHRPGGETAHFARGRLDFFDGHPVITLAVSAIIAGALAWLARDLHYDPNVLNLQSDGVESVIWQDRIEKDDQKSIWSALVLTTPQKAADLSDRLRSVPQVSDVGGMGLLYPPDRAERARLIEDLRKSAGPAASLPGGPGMSVLIGQLTLIRAGIGLRGAGATEEIKATLAAITERITKAIDAAKSLTPPAAKQAWDTLNAAFVPARDQLRQWLDRALAPGDPTLSDLPPLLREQWVGRDGSWLLMVFPTADPQGRSILDPDRLGAFVAGVRTVEPDVLGPPVQIYESTKVIVRAYTLAACYAVAVILIVLLLDFRSLPDALCCIAPVTVGFVGAFGAMGLTGTSLNFANLIVMPLIFGIGVDASVNMVHRWRLEPFGRPAGLSGGTGRGVTLAVLTTLIGFGSLLVARHRGIRSLGFVMVIGLGVTLLACYTVLPAILALRRKRIH